MFCRLNRLSTPTLNSLGKIGWLISLIYVVCVALRLARFNINTGGEASWKDNFFEGVPSPAGGILVLSPLVYEQSGLSILNFDLKIITPILFIIVSILLISKIPTYSFKKIVVPRSITIFLLLGIVLLFGLLLIFPFNVIALGSAIYLLGIPLSIFHYIKLKKGSLVKNLSTEDEPEDML